MKIELPRLKNRGRQPRGGERTFIVEFDADGEVLRIKEIRMLELPQVGIWHQPYWSARTHVLGTDETVPKIIIAAARAKILAEHRAADATP